MMPEKIKNILVRREAVFCIVLTTIVLAVYVQVGGHDFVGLDDNVYVTGNYHVQSGLSLEGIRWAFTTTHAEFWHPLTWLSLMFDYSLYGLNAGGYHITNLLFHGLSALLLFFFFNRVTGDFWRSAFVAAFFACHPLRVESVAWVSERKDVLSVFFWMLTLWLYVLYTEKQTARRYLFVLIAFTCGLMSKPIVVTLPAILILLDYWPLKRFERRQGGLILWQVKEKISLFALSACFSLLTIFAQPKLPIEGWPFSLASRLINALLTFFIYLKKMVWPVDLAILYPFIGQAPAWQIIAAILLLLAVTIQVIRKMKKYPFVFVGWFWFIVTIMPVIGIIPAGNNAMADRYAYLPSIGVSIMAAWLVPSVVSGVKLRRTILIPSSVMLIAVLTALSWQQTGLWKNNLSLFAHAARINQDNALAHLSYAASLTSENRFEEAMASYQRAAQMLPEASDGVMAYNAMGVAASKLRQLLDINIGYHLARQERHREAVDYYTRALAMEPVTPDHVTAYDHRGEAYMTLGLYEKAIADFNSAIRLDKTHVRSYKSKGLAYAKMGFLQDALESFHQAIAVNPRDAELYNNRGIVYADLGLHHHALDDFNKALMLNAADADIFYNRGVAFNDLGLHQQAFDDFNRAIHLNRNHPDAYNYRGGIYLSYGEVEAGCSDARRACELGNCELLPMAQTRGYCR